MKGEKCVADDEESNPVPGCSETDPIKPYDQSPYIIHERRTCAFNERSRSCSVLCFTLITLVLCFISFVFCQQCLFVILIFSACLCPFFHPMNAPLWLAIVLLTVGGWNFTMGALTVTWNYRKPD
jgi:hypothetical protein